MPCLSCTPIFFKKNFFFTFSGIGSCMLNNRKNYRWTQPRACPRRRLDLCCWVDMDILVSHHRDYIRPRTHRLPASRDEQKYRGKRLSPTSDNFTAPSPVHKLHAASSSRQKGWHQDVPCAQSSSISEDLIQKGQRSRGSSLGPHVFCIFSVGTVTTCKRAAGVSKLVNTQRRQSNG